MKLSIIIPVYNVNEYLKNTIENVLAQIYQDYELILVDDGSTDGSSEICDSFAEKDRRIKVIHQKNQGVSSARNAGVSVANGEYIGFVDSDDLIEPNMFKIMMSIAVEEDAEVVQCRHNRKPNVLNVEYGNDKRVVDGKTFVIELFSYTGGEYTNQVALWSKVYKKELFQNIHFPDGRTYEDEQETYKLCLHASKIVLISDELYHYVKRENSIITGIAPKKMIDKQLALKDRLHYLPTKLPETERACAESYFVYSKQITTKLYKEGSEYYFETLNNLLGCRKEIEKYISIYDRLYLLLLKLGIGRKWILSNDFFPIQNVLAKIKGKV